MINGCHSCFQEILGASYVVRCSSCQDGLYLLANATTSGVTAGNLLYPEAFSFCVPDCKKAHYAYVNNP